MAGLLTAVGVAGAAGVMEISGLGCTQPVIVDAAWARRVIEESLAGRGVNPKDEARRVRDGAVSDTDQPSARRARHARRRATKEPTVRWVHPATGAFVDPDGELTTEAYRPSRRIIDFVKGRDGRCRFPGCSINARFTDLDHVRAWPTGPTAASNLMCVCRTHHRVKQLPGWQVSLRPDGTILWVDPLGRRHVTHAVDHRHTLTARPGPSLDQRLTAGPEERAGILTRPAGTGVDATESPARAADANSGEGRLAANTPEDTWSALEFTLEHLQAAIPAHCRSRLHIEAAALRRHGIELQHAHPGREVHLTYDGARPARTHWHDRYDEPPF